MISPVVEVPQPGDANFVGPLPNTKTGLVNGVVVIDQRTGQTSTVAANGNATLKTLENYPLDPVTGLYTGPNGGLLTLAGTTADGTMPVFQRVGSSSFFTVDPVTGLQVPVLKTDLSNGVIWNNPVTNSGTQIGINQLNGAAFESATLSALGLPKNTTVINTTLRDGTPISVIPDAISGGTTIECKNICHLTNSDQVRAYQSTTMPIQLIVSPETKTISSSVFDLIYKSGGSIKVFNPATGQFTSW